MNKDLLKIVVCPVCKNKLIYEKKSEELICNFDLLAYPIKYGIPILLKHETRSLLKKI